MRYLLTPERTAAQNQPGPHALIGLPAIEGTLRTRNRVADRAGSADTMLSLLYISLRELARASVEETSELLGIATATVKREWSFAKAWLYSAMDAPPATSPPRTDDRATAVPATSVRSPGTASPQLD